MALNMLCPISGGNANNGSNAGVFALNLNNVRSNSNINVGFRCDLSDHGSRAVVATQPEKGASFLPCAKSACARFLVTTVKISGGDL